MRQRIVGEGPLGRSMISSRVLEDLRRDIILGNLDYGEPLVERDIADRFGISRGPVRRAFHVLEQEGLLQTLWNGRTTVIGLSPEDVADLYELRGTLETRAIRDAVMRKGKSDYEIERLAHLAEETRSDGRSSREVAEADIEFHRAIVLLADNRPLFRAWDLHQPTFECLLEITNSLGENEARAAYHLDIVRAIRRGDTEAAVRSLLDSLERGADVVRRCLAEVHEDPSIRRRLMDLSS